MAKQNKSRDAEQDALQANVRLRLLEMLNTYNRPLTKYPLAEQAQEIDTRLNDVAIHCANLGAVMTKAHMYLILNIDDNTLTRWLNAVKQGKGVEKMDEDEIRYMEARRAVIKKWLLYAESTGTELVSTKQVSAGPMFLMKSVYQYREYDKDAVQDVALGIEQFLKGMGRIRKAEQPILPPEDAE